MFSLNGGKKPINGFGKPKARLDEASGVSGWTVHDIRRTVMTNFQRLGIRQEVAEKVLNHVSGKISGISAVYARHQYSDEIRNALHKWSKELHQIVESRGFTNNVFYLNQ